MIKNLANLQKRVDFNRAPVEFDLRPYQRLAEEIQRIDWSDWSSENLVRFSLQLRKQAQDGTPQDELLVPAFALVCEVSHRLLGQRPFREQLLAGIALHQGKIVEMQTGEGKTLAAVMPAFLNGLTGKGIHILTFNDYLAERDARWMGPIYEFLGLTVAYVQGGMSANERKKAYAADITYLTAKEAGFDHLRAFLVYDPSERIQRPFHCAIIDEADSILIDEGRIPMVIAGNSSPGDNTELNRCAQVVRKLRPGIDYTLDEYRRNVYLTEQGISRAEQELGCGNLYIPENLILLTRLNNALHAQALLQRDLDYIVREGRVELVDEFTGRVMLNRHWPAGLQEAIEAKEGLTTQPGGRILGTMTLQNFLKNYPRLAGMTGTAQAGADLFKEFYNLDVTVIPPHRPGIRRDEPDLIFTDREAKMAALLQEIARIHSSGRPILVGTSSIEESEELATKLAETGITCQLLNAKNDRWEAELIAEAGARGGVTISTNMAGRGTDIRLGGRDGRDYNAVAALGGLYVIGTNHFESTRIDNQLRGRAGRQGDPGSSRFFISLEDELVERYGIRQSLPEKYRQCHQETPLTDPAVLRLVSGSQRIIEGQNHEIHRQLWKYSWVAERQRRRMMERREKILLGQDGSGLFQNGLPERYHALAEHIPVPVLSRVEKQVSLSVIDRLWADYLEEVESIREGVPLVQLAGKVPLDEFNKSVWEAYLDLECRIDAEIIAALGRVNITAEGIDLDREGLRGPSATWTYLVNDTPFGGRLHTILAPLLKKVFKQGY